MHIIINFYKTIYLLSSKIPKKDKFGIWSKIENICLDLINFIIAASLESPANKLPLLNPARIKIETLKKFIRICLEINIINNKTYLNLEADLQEISKMANGWIKYLQKKSQ